MVAGWRMKMWPCVRMNSLRWSASVCGWHLFSFPVSSHPATCCVAIQSNSTVRDPSLGNRILYVRKLMFLLWFHKRLIQEVSLKALNLKVDACAHKHVTLGSWWRMAEETWVTGTRAGVDVLSTRGWRNVLYLVFCSCCPVGLLSWKLKLYPDTAVIENNNGDSTVGIFFQTLGRQRLQLCCCSGTCVDSVWSILTAHRFGVCRIAYSLFCNPKLMSMAPLQLSGDVCRVVKNLSALTHRFSAEVAGDALPSSFSSRAANESFPCSAECRGLHISVLFIHFAT